MKKHVLLAAGLILGLTGCWSEPAARWKHVEYKYLEDKTNKATAFEPTVSAFCYTAKSDNSSPSSPAVTLTSLGEHGQQAYIQTIANRIPRQRYGKKVNDELREELGKNIVDEKKPDVDVAPTELKRTMVISVSKVETSKPGDRLIRTHVEVKPVGNSFEFSDFTAANTLTDTVDIASIKQTNTVELGVKATPTLTGWLEGSGELIGPSGKYERQVDEQVKQTYTKLNVDIKPNQLKITREGERNIDVTGITLIKLSLAMPGPDDTINGMPCVLVTKQTLSEGGKWLPPQKASVDIKLVTFPTRDDLKADISLSYQLRQIQEGRKTYIEGDDSVKIISGKVDKKGEVLVPLRDILPPLWKIEGTVKAKKEVLSAKGFLFGPQPVFFTNYSSSYEFQEWLKQYPGRQPEKITISDKPKGDVQLLMGNAQLSAATKPEAIRWKPPPKETPADSSNDSQ